MQNLSPNWSLRSLESLCKRVSSGGTPSRKNPEFYVNGSNLWVKSQELIDGYIYDTDEKITDAAVTKSSAKPYPSNTVLIAMYGATVGKLAILKTEATVNQAICALVVDDDVADYRFVYHALKLHRLSLISKAHGAAQQNLNQGLIKEFEISVPPLETQRQIAAILSAYDDLIENNARRIKVLEEMAGLIYREWFVSFRFPGHQGVRRVDSELGEIPEGWRAAKLGDIAEQVRRNVQPSEVSKETPYIGLEHLPRKSIALSEWAFPDSVTSSKLRFYQGEILFGKIRPYFHKVGVAPVNGICSSDIIVIRPKTPEFAAFTAMVTSSEDFVLQSVQTSQGTKMPRANWDVLVKYPVFLPDSALLERFNGIAANIILEIRNFVFKNQNLRRTRDLLLPKLISGELDVSQLGADPEDVQDLAALRAAKAAEGDSPALSLDELKLALERG